MQDFQELPSMSFERVISCVWGLTEAADRGVL